MQICPQRVAEAGLTGSEFGASIGVSKAYISQIESGRKTTLSETKTRALCQRYGCALAWLVNSPGSEPARPAPRQMAADVEGPEWIVSGAGRQGIPKRTPSVERRPDGTIRYNFVVMWSDEQLREILAAAEEAEDWGLVGSIAAEMQRRGRTQSKVSRAAIDKMFPKQ